MATAQALGQDVSSLFGNRALPQAEASDTPQAIEDMQYSNGTQGSTSTPPDAVQDGDAMQCSNASPTNANRSGEAWDDTLASDAFDFDDAKQGGDFERASEELRKLAEDNKAILDRKLKDGSNPYLQIQAELRAMPPTASIDSRQSMIDKVNAFIDIVKARAQKDLPTMMASEDGAQMIQRRAELMDLTRSAFRSQFIDADEDFTRDTISFTGLPEVLRMLFLLISADTGYPMTRLFGMSPAGENATGEGDMNNYYDMVRSAQVAELQPILLRLVRIISQWKGIDEPYIEFRPLETMNEKEKAELDKQIADTAKVEADTYKAYIDAGVLDASEVRNMKWGNTLGDMPVEHELPNVEGGTE